MDFNNLKKIIDKDKGTRTVGIKTNKDNHTLEEDVSLENFRIEIGTIGKLMPVDDIPDEEVDVSSEGLIADIIKKPSAANPNARTCSQPNETPLGVYSNNGKHVTIVIGGFAARAMTLAPGIIAAATGDMLLDVTIVSANDDHGQFMYLELEQAIQLSDADINVHLAGIIPIYALSILHTEASVDVGVAGIVIKPDLNGTYGSPDNITEVVDAYNSYTEMLFTELMDSGILTLDEVDQLKSRTPVHITRDIFSERYTQLKSV